MMHSVNTDLLTQIYNSITGNGTSSIYKDNGTGILYRVISVIVNPSNLDPNLTKKSYMVIYSEMKDTSIPSGRELVSFLENFTQCYDVDSVVSSPSLIPRKCRPDPPLETTLVY